MSIRPLFNSNHEAQEPAQKKPRLIINEDSLLLPEIHAHILFFTEPMDVARSLTVCREWRHRIIHNRPLLKMFLTAWAAAKFLKSNLSYRGLEWIPITHEERSKQLRSRINPCMDEKGLHAILVEALQFDRPLATELAIANNKLQFLEGFTNPELRNIELLAHLSHFTALTTLENYDQTRIQKALLLISNLPDENREALLKEIIQMAQNFAHPFIRFRFHIEVFDLFYIKYPQLQFENLEKAKQAAWLSSSDYGKISILLAIGKCYLKISHEKSHEIAMLISDLMKSAQISNLFEKSEISYELIRLLLKLNEDKKAKGFLPYLIERDLYSACLIFAKYYLPQGLEKANMYFEKAFEVFTECEEPKIPSTLAPMIRTLLKINLSSAEIALERVDFDQDLEEEEIEVMENLMGSFAKAYLLNRQSEKAIHACMEIEPIDLQILAIGRLLKKITL